MFKNLSFYRLPESLAIPEDLDANLAAWASRPLSEFEEYGAGWARVDPLRWSATVNGATLVALEVSKKPIPADAVKREVAKRVAKWTAERPEPPTKSQRAAIKDGVRAEFVARIPARVKTIRAYIDTAAGVLVVDTASDKAAEEVVKALRVVVPGFACEAIKSGGFGAGYNLREMLKSSNARPFAFGDRVTFACDESTAAFTGVVMQAEEVSECIATGMPVTRLGLSLGGQSFVLDDALRVRSYRAEDQAETDGDASAELDARLMLLSGNVRELLDALNTAFGWRS